MKNIRNGLESLNPTKGRAKIGKQTPTPKKRFETGAMPSKKLETVRQRKKPTNPNGPDSFRDGTIHSRRNNPLKNVFGSWLTMSTT